VLAAAEAATESECDQRAEVLIEDRGRTERIIDSSAPLLTVRLTDLGPVGAYVTEPGEASRDVVCDLRPGEARKLAAAVLDLADRLDPPELS